MEMNKTQREFILLRADGISFDKIATQLKVGKASLIQWSKLFENEIKEIQFEAFIKIKELHSFNTQSRYKTLLEQLTIIDDGIVNADFSKATIKDLTNHYLYVVSHHLNANQFIASSIVLWNRNRALCLYR